MPYHLTKPAERDLDKIALYTLQTWGGEQLITYMQQLQSAFEVISDTPDIGRERQFNRFVLRAFRVRSHVVFYRLNKKGDSVEIVRVLHKRQDVARLF